VILGFRHFVLPRGLGHWLVMAAVLAAAPAQANDQDMVNRSTARALAEAAADDFDRADYAAALDKFTRAQQLYPAPTLSFMQARCLFALGRWVEAFEMYTVTARTRLDVEAPEPFHRAVLDAGREAQSLEARLPRIEIRVPKHPGLNVSVDDVPLPVALYGILHPMNPGEHRVKARLGERAYFEHTVVLSARDQQLLEIPSPPTPTPTEPRIEPYRRSERASPVDRPSPPWVIPTAFTVGGVGTATAMVSLIFGSSVKSDLDRVCTPGCPPQYADDVNAYRLYRTLFISGTVLGAAGLGVGLYFALDEPTEAFAVSLQVAPTGAGLNGNF
jgi:hypothetical protein